MSDTVPRTQWSPTTGGNPAERLVEALRRSCKGNSLRDRDRLLEKFYTDRDFASYCVGRVAERCDFSSLLLIEPSAGDGAFVDHMPTGSIAIDVEPGRGGNFEANFLEVELPSDRDIVIIGNPPFRQAVPFFNHGARHATIMALILPRTFRKGSVLNRLDRAFHCVHDETVPERAFLFRGKPFNVPAAFQIWERRDHPRDLIERQTKHDDFEFTGPDEADFAIQRVGADAGRVHHDFHLSDSSTHFIRGGVEHIMRGLDLRSAAANVTGPPSISKAEIVSLYCGRLHSPTGMAA